jgi:hypothetical protein
MTRFNDILNGIKESVNAAQKTYKGIKRSDLKDSDFLFPETRSFPIVSPVDIPDAISNFGRMKGQMSYDAFLKKLYNMAKRKGPEFVAALPKATKEKLGIKTAKAESCGCDYEINEVYPENEYEEDRLSLLSQDMPNEEEPEEDEEENDEYKQSYYDMSVGSLRAIMNHAKDILDYLDSPMVKENLTAPHLQGMIAVAEDHLRSIHDFVMFVETDDDDYEETESAVNPEEPTTKKRKKIKVSDLPHYEYQYKKYPGVTTTMGQNDKPGLWENIRKKRERMGKKYKPAKPGDKDRPDPDAWKQAQK